MKTTASMTGNGTATLTIGDDSAPTRADYAMQLLKRCEALPIATLQEVARQMYADDRAEADDVLHYALKSLERRMPESDFIAFCNVL